MELLDEVRLNLKDVVKHRKKNQRKIKSLKGIVNKDVAYIKSFPFAATYEEEIEQTKNFEIGKMTLLTNSQQFAEELAHFHECQKWLALYYMNTDEGKKAEHKVVIMEDLLFIYDMMLHATISHYLQANQKQISWDNCKFYTDGEVKSPYILNFATQSATNICTLVDAIDKDNNIKIYNTYLNILNTTMSNPKDEPFPDFI